MRVRASGAAELATGGIVLFSLTRPYYYGVDAETQDLENLELGGNVGAEDMDEDETETL